MLVGVPTVVLGAMLADLLGNSATRPFTRITFGVYVCILLEVPATLGGVWEWTTTALLSLI